MDDDLRLQVQSDLGRFDELRTLALRLGHRHDQHVSKGDIFYETENDEGENSWPSEAYAFYDDDWGAEPFWSWSEDDYYYYGDYDYEENELYEGFDYYEYDPASEPQEENEGHKANMEETEENELYYKGKGKKGKSSGAMGVGCYICGSKWHYAKDCPVAENNRPYGKSDGKGRGFRAKGTSKGKFGKGKFCKGYGKSWNPKGKGKSGSYFLDSRYDTQIRHAREGLAIGGRLVRSAVLKARSASVGHANTDLDSEPLSESRSNVRKKIVTFQDNPWTSSTTSASSSAKTAPKADDILRSGREWTKGAATSSTATEDGQEPLFPHAGHVQHQRSDRCPGVDRDLSLCQDWSHRRW